MKCNATLTKATDGPSLWNQRLPVAGLRLAVPA